MDLDLQRLCERVEDRYPRSSEGAEAYSRWKQQGWFWSESDYASPGFALKYTTKQFVARAEAAYELLRDAVGRYVMDPAHAEIIDFGAGPGCAAAGAAKFLLQQGADDPRVTFLDPVREWEPATLAFQEQGIEAEFELCPGLEEMIDSFRERVLRNSGLLVVCISHVLKDFGNKGRELLDWWEALQQAASGRLLIVLVMDRFRCEPFLPGELPGGGRLFVPDERLPRGTVNGSFGAALLMPEAAFQYAPAMLGVAGPAPRLPATSTHGIQRPAPRLPCPDCGSPMVERTNRNDGSHLRGCTRYPACRGTRSA